MGNIYLIRHGQASFGADDYDVLSPAGIRQSEVLGQHLKAMGMRFGRCISGSLLRQQDTGRHCLGQLDQPPALETDEAFNELDAESIIRHFLPQLLRVEPQALEVLRNGPRYRKEFQRLFSMVIGYWLDDEEGKPDLQSWPEFLEQVSGGLRRIMQQAEPSQDIAVFTSGGTITALLHLVTGLDARQAFALNWQIVNTSMHQLKFRPDEVTLASFNGYSHLQLLRDPALITYR